MRIGLLFAVAMTFAVSCAVPAVLTAVVQAQTPSGDLEGLVEIGNGRSLYLECRGSGSPTVNMEAGLPNRGDV